MGRPPTSVGQAKKSDSTTPWIPVLAQEFAAEDQVPGVGLREVADVDAEPGLDHHADDGGEVGVADEEIVHLFAAFGNFAECSGE